MVLTFYWWFLLKVPQFHLHQCGVGASGEVIIRNKSGCRMLAEKCIIKLDMTDWAPLKETGQTLWASETMRGAVFCSPFFLLIIISKNFDKQQMCQSLCQNIKVWMLFTHSHYWDHFLFPMFFSKYFVPQLLWYLYNSSKCFAPSWHFCHGFLKMNGAIFNIQPIKMLINVYCNFNILFCSVF